MAFFLPNLLKLTSAIGFQMYLLSYLWGREVTSLTASQLFQVVQDVVTTPLSSATGKYIAISHSNDDIEYSDRTNILNPTFAAVEVQVEAWVTHLQL